MVRHLLPLLVVPLLAAPAAAGPGYSVDLGERSLHVAREPGGIVVEVAALTEPGAFVLTVDMDADGQPELELGPGLYRSDRVISRMVSFDDSGEGMPRWQRIDLFPPGTFAVLSDEEHLGVPSVALTSLPDGNVLVEVNENRDGRLDARVTTEFEWGVARQEELGGPGPFPWPAGVDPKFREGFGPNVATAIQACRPKVELRFIDCSEPPCIAAMRQKVGFDRDQLVWSCPSWLEVYGPTVSSATDVLTCEGGGRERIWLLSPHMAGWLDSLDEATREAHTARLYRRWEEMKTGWSCR